VGVIGLGDLWAWHTRVTNLNLNLNLRSKFSIFDSFRDIHVHIYEFLKFVGVKVGVSNFFGSNDRY